MELIILLAASIKFLCPVLLLVITVFFAVYVIKHRHNSSKIKKATQILFYLSGSIYYLSRMLRGRR